MQALFECTKEFELLVSFTDTDISLTQECVALATGYPNLAHYWNEAIALTITMMDAPQRELFRFDRTYPEAIEVAVFGGDEENPIVIADDEE